MWPSHCAKVLCPSAHRGECPTFLQGKFHFCIGCAWRLELAQWQAVKVSLLEDHRRKCLLLFLLKLSQRNFSAWQSLSLVLILTIFTFPNFWKQVWLLFCHRYQNVNVALQQLLFLLLIRKKEFQLLWFLRYSAIKQQNVCLSSACS